MEATNKRLTSEDLDKLAKKHITLNRQINSSPNQFLSKMIKQAKIELNAEMTVEEIKQILTDIKVEINYEGYTYNLAFEPNDDELKIKESGSATGREVYYHWETVKDIVHNIKQEKVFHSPVGNEVHKAKELKPKQEQTTVQKGQTTMNNNVIIGTIDYKAIKEKKYININSADECKRVADTLVENGVPFSGRIQPNLQKGTITVSPENYKAVIDILAKVKSTSPAEKKNTTIGNKPYKYIYDKKYINSNEEEIRKLADILTREGFEFSGNIYNADKAAITVSGAENQKLANAYLNYVRNTTVVNHIADYGFTLVDVQTLTVKDKNEFTMSFENYEQMESAFNDIENEFFHPTYYQLGLTSDAFNGVYAVFAMDSTTDEEKHIEKNTLGDFQFCSHDNFSL